MPSVAVASGRLPFWVCGIHSVNVSLYAYIFPPACRSGRSDSAGGVCVSILLSLVAVVECVGRLWQRDEDPELVGIGPGYSQTLPTPRHRQARHAADVRHSPPADPGTPQQQGEFINDPPPPPPPTQSPSRPRHYSAAR